MAFLSNKLIMYILIISYLQFINIRFIIYNNGIIFLTFPNINFTIVGSDIMIAQFSCLLLCFPKNFFCICQIFVDEEMGHLLHRKIVNEFGCTSILINFVMYSLISKANNYIWWLFRLCILRSF